MSAYRIWLEQCKGCNPWTRVVNHPITNEPIVQALHEDDCHAWPKQQRSDGQEVEHGAR